MPVFQPPTAHDVPRVLPETRGVPFLLMRHYSELPRGRTVIKTGGVYRTLDNPEQSTLDVATEVYLGGHLYTVTQTVADALTAAGYGSGISADPATPTRNLTWGFLAGSTWDDFVDQYKTWG
jgi:hypothetical protein